jgi:hypothetical protein
MVTVLMMSNLQLSLAGTVHAQILPIGDSNVNIFMLSKLAVNEP